MKNIFKPEDFHRFWMGKDSACSPEQAAETANEKLNALIESWTLVYGKRGNPYWYEKNYLSNDRKEIATHKARLAFIEEIVKEPCKHEPIDDYYVCSDVIKCKHCCIELKAIWSAK